MHARPVFLKVAGQYYNTNYIHSIHSTRHEGTGERVCRVRFFTGKTLITVNVTNAEEIENIEQFLADHTIDSSYSLA